MIKPKLNKVQRGFTEFDSVKLFVKRIAEQKDCAETMELSRLSINALDLNNFAMATSNFSFSAFASKIAKFLNIIILKDIIMRTLQYRIDLEHFRKIRDEIVPSLFTAHQFALIEKKMTNMRMTQSEKNEFSRTVSRKMNAINRITNIVEVFVYGQEKISKDRLAAAVSYVRRFSRQFRGKHVLLSGSFLYQRDFKDIDIFVVSKYDKEDYYTEKFHINYLTEDVYDSLFFASISKLCVSNRKMPPAEIKEMVNIDTFISLYQELFNDFDRNFKGIRATLRDFLIQACFLENKQILNSLELRQLIDSIIAVRNKKEIVQNIFTNAIVLSQEPKKVIASMKQIILSYKELMKEYAQHKNYYSDLIRAFTRVIAIES